MTDPLILPTMQLDDDAFYTVRHPLDPEAEVRLAFLSDAVGLQRSHLRLAKLAPGKKSFPLHSHYAQEEFIYILSGTATAVIGSERREVGPGTYIGYPAGGAPHTLINTGEREVLYLMGGERTDLEVAYFPEQDKMMIGTGETVTLADTDKVDRYSLQDWVAQAVKSPDDTDGGPAR